jgi:Glycosyltransferase family 87
MFSWAGLVAVHRTVAMPLSRTAAVAAVDANAQQRALLAIAHPTRVVLTPVDSHHEIVWFYRGPRLVLSDVVTTSGRIAYAIEYRNLKYAYGSPIANSAWMLALLAILFVLMTAVKPLWRLRNLDVLVAVSTTLSILLLNAETPELEMLATVPALLYLACRCACRALRGAAPGGEAVPLYEIVTSRCAQTTQLRLLRFTAVTIALIVVMVGYSSGAVVDVANAVLEGATSILHGLVPYGHVPGILHGDTYPLGSYLFYVPFAALTPATSIFNFPQWTLNVAIVAALAVAVALLRYGPGLRTRAARDPRSEAAGLRMAVAWLTFPPMLVTVSTGTTDVALAAMLLGALLLWRRPAAATTVLAVGGWFKLYPLALMPAAIAPLRGRALWRALLGAVLVSGAMIGALVAIGGTAGVGQMVHAMAYQVSRTDPHSLWSWIGSVPLQQLAQGATLALVAGAFVVFRRDPSLAQDRTRVAALFAAVLLGLQIAAGYWTYLYLTWVLPFVVLSLLSDQARRDGELRRT